MPLPRCCYPSIYLVRIILRIYSKLFYFIFPFKLKYVSKQDIRPASAIGMLPEDSSFINFYDRKFSSIHDLMM